MANSGALATDYNPFDYLGFVATESLVENANDHQQGMALALTSNNQGVGGCKFSNPYLCLSGVQKTISAVPAR